MAAGRELPVGNSLFSNSPFVVYVVYPIALLAATVFLTVHPITDPDFWYHVAFGREALQNGSIPRVDLFTHTASGRPWISSGWLPDIVLHLLYRSMGTAGPIFLVAGCIAAGALLTYLVAIRFHGGGGHIAAVLLIALLASYPRFNPRPDIFSQLLIIPMVLLLTCTERGVRDGTFSRDKLLWLLPLLIIIWANLHALFFLGILVVVFYAGWRLLLWSRTKEVEHLRALVPCAACGIVWMLNPYGWKMLLFTLDNATLPGVGERVFELKPLLSRDLLSGVIPLHLVAALALLVAVTAWLAWRSRGAMSSWRVACLTLFVLLALAQRRQVGLAAAAMPALILPAAMPSAAPRRRWLSPALAGTIMAVIISLRLAGVLEISRGLPRTGVDCQWFPCGAAAFLKDHPPPENLFNDLYTGGYLLHELGPETRVFIDGRLEIFKGEIWNDYFAPPEGRMTLQELFSKYSIRTCLLDVRGAPGNPKHTANVLAAREEWVLVYFDDQYAVFVHQGTETEEYVRLHGYQYVNPLDWNRMGTALQNAGVQVQALGEARRALDQAPGAAAAHAALAMVYLNMGNRSEGEKHLRRAQEINPQLGIAPVR